MSDIRVKSTYFSLFFRKDSNRINLYFYNKLFL